MRIAILAICPEEPIKNHITEFYNKENCDYFFVTHDKKNDSPNCLGFNKGQRWEVNRNFLYEHVPKNYDYYVFTAYDVEFRSRTPLSVLDQLLNDLSLNPAVLIPYDPNKSEYLKKENGYGVLLFSNNQTKIIHKSLLNYFFPMPIQFGGIWDTCHLFNVLETPFAQNVICTYNVTGSGLYSKPSSQPSSSSDGGKEAMQKIHEWFLPCIRTGKIFSSADDYKQYFLKKSTKKEPTYKTSDVNYLSWYDIKSIYDLNHPFFKNKYLLLNQLHKEFDKLNKDITGYTGAVYFYHGKKNVHRDGIINHLIQKNSYRSYLEIGLRHCDNFDKIDVNHKIGVDPFPVTTSSYYEKCKSSVKETTSDNFFKSNKEKFDIIFIDGLHEEQQVIRDVNNSLKFLNDNGIIIMHDCNPASELFQRNKLHERANEHVIINGKKYGAGIWCGTAWKAYAHFRMTQPNIYMAVIDTDWGIGVIDPRKPQKLYVDNDVSLDTIKTYAYLATHRKELLNLITVKDFLKSF